MIDLVNLILKYGSKRYGIYSLDVTDGNGGSYRNAGFSLAENNNNNKLFIDMNFFSKIPEIVRLNGIATDEPMHECNFLIQNADIILDLYVVPKYISQPNIYIKNCIVQPDIFKLDVSIINCIESEEIEDD